MSKLKKSLAAGAALLVFMGLCLPYASISRSLRELSENIDDKLTNEEKYNIEEVIAESQEEASRHHAFMNNLFDMEGAVNDPLIDPLAICMPSSCPFNSQHVHPFSCKQKFIDNNFDSGLQALRDPETFIPKLLHFFHGRRVTLVGDSISGQWFQMLSCRLGMDIKWYEEKDLPQQYVDNRHNAPRNLLKYGIAHYATQDEDDNKRDTSCQELRTTFQYYRLDKFDDDMVPMEEIFDFITDSSDIVVFNIGAHYRGALPLLDVHLAKLLKLCGQLNNNDNSKHCFFRETLPAHFQFSDFPCGEYVLESEEETKCGPIKGDNIYNQNVHFYAKKEGVPVVKASMLQEGWRWHFNEPLDCRHYCFDNEVFDLLHESLLEAAKEI